MTCYACETNDPMPFTCKFCKHEFCAEHRLPEDHDCSGLQVFKQKKQEELRKGKKVSIIYSKKVREQKWYEPLKQKIESNPNLYIGVFLLALLLIMLLTF